MTLPSPRIRPLTCLLALLLVGSALTGQDDGAARALAGAYQKSKLMVAISDVAWRPGLCLAVGRLPVGGTLSLDLPLEAGYEYTFVGSGEEALGDLDLHLLDAGGQALTADREDDDTPIVTFAPTDDGAYRLQLHAVAADRPEVFVSVGLLRSGGRPLADADYRALTQRLAAAEPVTAPNGDGDWVLYAALLPADGITLERPAAAATGFALSSFGNPAHHPEFYLLPPGQTRPRLATADGAGRSRLPGPADPAGAYRLRVQPPERSTADHPLLLIRATDAPPE